MNSSAIRILADDVALRIDPVRRCGHHIISREVDYRVPVLVEQEPMGAFRGVGKEPDGCAIRVDVAREGRDRIRRINNLSHSISYQVRMRLSHGLEYNTDDYPPIGRNPVVHGSEQRKRRIELSALKDIAVHCGQKVTEMVMEAA